MVNFSADLDSTFGALSDPVRRAVLERLRRGETGVSELAAEHGISLPAFLKHLRVLEDAGLLASRKEGRVRFCRLLPEALAPAGDWIARNRAFWDHQLDALGRYLDEATPQKELQ
jgi:DNA-binding transcriptional ArsR family regulator